MVNTGIISDTDVKVNPGFRLHSDLRTESREITSKIVAVPKKIPSPKRLIPISKAFHCGFGDRHDLFFFQ